MEDNFRIAVADERVAARFELLAKLGVIVNFTVENEDGFAVRRKARLISALKINDLQTDGAQSNSI